MFFGEFFFRKHEKCLKQEVFWVRAAPKSWSKYTTFGVTPFHAEGSFRYASSTFTCFFAYLLHMLWLGSVLFREKECVCVLVCVALNKACVCVCFSRRD